MQTETLAFAQYWRNSLADTETSKAHFVCKIVARFCNFRQKPWRAVLPRRK